MFPFNRFPGVDVLLGPEMRSTGEVMGIDKSVGLAFMKSQLGAGQVLPQSGTVFISVPDSAKDDILPAAQILSEVGFKIMATKGTAAYLADKGIAVVPVMKVFEGRPHIVDHMKNREIGLVINLVSDKRTVRDSMIIRQTALLYGIPYTTTAAGAKAMAQAIREMDGTGLTVKSLQEYYAGQLTPGTTHHEKGILRTVRHLRPSLRRPG